jgi:hypothetical protein
VSQIILALLTLSSLLIFVSVFWQHIAAASALSMVHSLSYGTVKLSVGTLAMVLGWGSVALDIIAAIGIYVMVASITVLAETFG